MRNEDRNGATVRAFLTCNPSSLAAAKASFSALFAENPGEENETGLAKKRIDIVRDSIVQEIDREGSKRRRGSAKKLAGMRDGQTVSETTISSKKRSSQPRSTTVLAELAEQKAEGANVQTRDPQEVSIFHETCAREEDELPNEHRTAPSSENTIPTLEEVLRSLTSLEEALDGGSIGLTAFVVWWIGAVSAAEVSLKSTFLNPSTTRRKGRN